MKMYKDQLGCDVVTGLWKSPILYETVSHMTAYVLEARIGKWEKYDNEILYSSFQLISGTKLKYLRNIT